MELTNLKTEISDYLSKDILAEGVEFGSDTPFSDMGLDSHALIELVLFIERRFKISMSDGQITSDHLQSVDTLANCVHGLLNGGS